MTVLQIRIILNGILFLILFSGSIFFFAQKQNGITKAMAWTALFASLYVGILIIIGTIDVCLPENYSTQTQIRYWWNWIALGELISLAWLGIKLLKGER